MKHRLLILLGLIMVAQLLSSCVKEQIAGGDDSNVIEGIPVKISLASGTRIAIEDDDFAYLDYQVTCLRIIGYDTKKKNLVFNRYVPNTDISGGNPSIPPDDTTPVLWEAQSEILTGDYTIVFIANEDVDSGMAAILADDDQIATLADLQGVSFSHESLKWNGRIPMIGVYENVKVLADNHINIGGTDYKDTWSVELNRLAVRVDFTLNLTKTQAEQWEKGTMVNGNNGGFYLKFANVPKRMYLFANTDNSPGTTQVQYEGRFGLPGYNYYPGYIEKEPDDSYTITYPRTILPESYFTDKSNANKAVIISTDMSSDGVAVNAVSAKIGFDLSVPDYTLPRDHYFTVNAQVKEFDAELDLTLSVLDWNTMELISDINGPYELWVEETRVEVPAYEGDITLDVETTYEGVWSVEFSTHETDPSDPLAQIPDWIEVSNTPSTLIKNQTLNLKNKYNDTDGERTAYLHLTAGRLTKVISVVQAEDDSPLKGITLGTTLRYPARTYVGAFWKNDQTGERLIRIPVQTGMDGPWLALVVSDTEANPPVSVIDPADTWIRLDGKESDDTNIWQVGQEPEDAEVYHLPDDADTWVKGTTETGYIYFRIGLTSTLSNGAAPRYGIVRLYYNDYSKYHDIYIRQGHEPDFLMQKDDNNEAGSITTEWGGTAAQPRPDAVKWSPYNLTAAEFNNGDMDNSVQFVPRTTLVVGGGGSGGGEFTDYPSQAGAFFKWAGPSVEERYAYNPVLNTNIPATANSSSYWNNLAATHETCPPGYRRANDGSTTVGNVIYAIADSEMRQSLYLNPFADVGSTALASAGNVVWGYYADGFFDRRGLGSSASGAAMSVVEGSTSRAAYVGMLYFNPNTYASLFLPAAGHRSLSNLTDTGKMGCYWSSSSQDGTYGLGLYFGSSYVGQYFRARNYAWSVRCVAE